MKKALKIIGTIAIGTIGLLCCYMWMKKPGFSSTQFMCLFAGVYLVAMPTYDYWYKKLNS